MARKCKSYEELELSDDFMFAKVMQNKALCKELLELIMGFPIADIVYLEEQKTLDVAANAKSVRMDVYAADENQTIYDIEMQTGKKKYLPKRSRYYQGIIDIDETDKGIEYQSLNKSYVIFICTFDPFDAGRHIYSFENRCIQDLNLELGGRNRENLFERSGAAERCQRRDESIFGILVQENNRNRLCASTGPGSSAGP